MNSSKSFPWALAFFFTIFYLLLSPLTYFRHDDWLMLGNAVTILPRDWSFLWRTSWYTSPTHQEIWFFRPFFKLAIWGAFQAFQFNHYLWIMTHWVLVLGALYFAMKSLDNLDFSKSRSALFAILFLSSFSFHFANVVWVGEGMMNSPQLFLLSLSVYLFSKEKVVFHLFSLVTYILALGFKESSAFLPLFLFALVLATHQLKQQWKILLSHFICMFIYLIFRLGFLPFNPGYKPHLSLDTFFRPTLYFIFFLSLPFLVVLLNTRTHFFSALKLGLKRFFPFSFYLILLVAPHVGHPFFSPGWLLLPGFFTLWAFCISLDESVLIKMPLKKVALITFCLSFLSVAWQVRKLGWLQWGMSQKEIHAFIKNLPEEDLREVFIETCIDPHHPQATFERVVGATENLQHLWNLHHSTQVDFNLTPCGGGTEYHKPAKGRVFAKWDFPNFRAE